MASEMLHAGVLVLLLWQPLTECADAAPPSAIELDCRPRQPPSPSWLEPASGQPTQPRESPSG